MRLKARITREIRFLKNLNRTLGRIKSIASDSENLACDDFEAAVDAFRDRQAMVFEDQRVTYGELDAIANRYASWARDQNLRRGQVVALVMPNRLEYLPIWMGLAKVGVVTALINNQLVGQALCHCLNIASAAHILVDGETLAGVEAVRGQLEKHPIVWTLSAPHGDQRDLAKALKGASALRPDNAIRKGLQAHDTALLIFTSGTTGLPKAAKITHARVQLYMRGFAGAVNATPNDRIYVALPLYHATGGLCATGAALLNGGAVILKRKFTASHFWQDIKDNDCTMFVYIGELCRYLVNQPPSNLDQGHKLRLIFGNGMRADVWERMLQRFQVGEVLEFYGSTEGNVSLFNFDGKVGALARIPRYLRKRFNVRLILIDPETEQPLRGPNGLCIEPPVGEAGECLGHIGGGARDSYTGYADKQASEKKIVHDVFEKGDAYFRTGDLMRRDSEEFFYFVDRIGDTFRWKGENIATSEVAAALSSFPGVKEANVYGVTVPGAEGRAGMAQIVVGDGFDIKGLAAHMDGELPVAARPLFVRLQKEIETTGTFKYRKVDLVEAVFDPEKTKVATYYKNPKTGYVKITKAFMEKIASGEVKI